MDKKKKAKKPFKIKPDREDQFCTECGNRSGHRAKFCARCGHAYPKRK